MLNKEMLTVEEFSLKANITLAHTRQLLREKKVNGIKIGKEWRIFKEDADKYLGITTDIKYVEKEMYIKKLESEIKNYELQINMMKNLVETISNIIEG